MKESDMKKFVSDDLVEELSRDFYDGNINVGQVAISAAKAASEPFLKAIGLAHEWLSAGLKCSTVHELSEVVKEAYKPIDDALRSLEGLGPRWTEISKSHRLIAFGDKRVCCEVGSRFLLRQKMGDTTIFEIKIAEIAGDYLKIRIVDSDSGGWWESFSSFFDRFDLLEVLHGICSESPRGD